MNSSSNSADGSGTDISASLSQTRWRDASAESFGRIPKKSRSSSRTG
jgi:hypothetical protein